MIGRSTTRLALTAALATMLASPAVANKLLNERWMMNASASDIQKEIASGSDIWAVHPKHDFTPLMVASKHGNLEAIEALLEVGAEINAANSANVTPLHIAARHNSPEMVKFLLDAGANPVLQTNKGWFPAEMAVRFNPMVTNHPVIERLFAPLGDIPALPGEASSVPCDGWRVQPGDTGYIIAGEGLGDRSRFVEIARLNGISGRNMHKVGMCLKLPARRVSACNGYVVQPSDRRLGDVAVAALGDRNRWPEIARLNGITAENPYRNGQCLQLPG